MNIKIRVVHGVSLLQTDMEVSVSRARTGDQQRPVLRPTPTNRHNAGILPPGPQKTLRLPLLVWEARYKRVSSDDNTGITGTAHQNTPFDALSGKL